LQDILAPNFSFGVLLRLVGHHSFLYERYNMIDGRIFNLIGNKALDLILQFSGLIAIVSLSIYKPHRLKKTSQQGRFEREKRR
jgi:hypothetical protein